MSVFNAALSTGTSEQNRGADSRGGTVATRVHPSPGLEYYHRQKRSDHPAVRLVQYPGEGHCNRKQPAMIDFFIACWYG